MVDWAAKAPELLRDLVTTAAANGQCSPRAGDVSHGTSEPPCAAEPADCWSTTS